MKNRDNEACTDLDYAILCRRSVLKVFGLGFVIPLLACGQREQKMQKGIVLNVVLYSYIDRVIIDIIFNGTHLGVANKFGGTGIIAGVSIPFGAQELKWTLDGPEGTSRNGEQVEKRNKLLITMDLIPKESRYLGLHLYPDNTAEFTFAEFIPDSTPRGDAILKENKLHL